jgi:hypothetical protein
VAIKRRARPKRASTKKPNDELAVKPVQVSASGLPPRKAGGRFAEPYGMLLPPTHGSTLEVSFMSSLKEFSAELYASVSREWRFDISRLWKFDFAWVEPKVAVEVEGGVFSRGAASKGHAGGAAYASNCEKYNVAQHQGWSVIRLSPDMLAPPSISRWLNVISDLVHWRSEHGRGVLHTSLPNPAPGEVIGRKSIKALFG